MSPGAGLLVRGRRLSADARGAVRAGRRLAVGAHDLSLAAAAGWLVERVQRRPTPRENSSFCWIVADHERTTLCWLHNYWSDAYGIDRPSFIASLVDLSGRTVAEWALTLEPDATVLVDVRAECRRRDVPLPFEGQLLLVSRDERLVPGRPVQAFVEYVGDDGEMSGVHGQYGLMRSPLAQFVGGSRVDATPGSRSGLVVVNAYDGPHASGAMRSVVEVLSADGTVHRAALPPLVPRATARVYLDEVVPGLCGALDGRAGQVRVRVPCPSSRVLTFVERSDGGLVVNHATIDRGFDQRPGRQAGWVASVPSFSIAAFLDGGRDTVVTLPNVWGPVVADRTVELTLHDSSGAVLGAGRVRVGAHQTVDVSLRDLFGLGPAGGPPVAHAQVTLVEEDPSVERPAILDVVLGYWRGGDLEGEVQVGSDFFNAAVPPGVGVPDVRRTRVFARVRGGGGERSTVFVGHPVSPGGDACAPTRPILRLLGLDGTLLAEAPVEVAPGGFVSGTVEELFGVDPRAHAVVRVRDTGARLYGYHMVEMPGARSVVVDHLVGG